MIKPQVTTEASLDNSLRSILDLMVKNRLNHVVMKLPRLPYEFHLEIFFDVETGRLHTQLVERLMNASP